MNPLAIGGAAAALFFLLSGRKAAAKPPTGGTATPPGGTPPVTYPSQPPGTVLTPVGAGTVAERMAAVLATGNAQAIRFEAGRLRQEGYVTQAAQLEAAAAELEAAQAAGVPPPVVTAPPVVTVPPIVVPTPPIVVAPEPSPPASTVPTPQPWIDGVPAQLQGVTLRYVAPPAPFDARVLLLQGRLLELGYSVGKDGADGKFGADTRTAVKAFQKANKLTQDGIVGADTLAKLADPRAVRGALPPLVTVPLPPASSTPASSVPSSGPWIAGVPAELQGVTLRYVPPPAPYDVRVGLLQGRLAELGYMSAADVDGKFGTKTLAAVKAFQTQNRLTADGIVGAGTLAALGGVGAVRMQGDEMFGFDRAPAQPLPGTPLPGLIPPMLPPDPDPPKALAARLALNLTAAPEGREDRTLVANFQAQEGLQASGYYGPATAEALALRYGIIPPVPRYWSKKHAGKAKANYRAMLQAEGRRDPQRAEEWAQAARL